jgi:hypothetical protein
MGRCATRWQKQAALASVTRPQSTSAYPSAAGEMLQRGERPQGATSGLMQCSNKGFSFDHLVGP